MTQNDASGPAYPQTRPNHTLGETFPAIGMSKREVFAAHALQGFCANPQVFIATSVPERAQAAVMQADALLEALNPKAAPVEAPKS